MPKPFNLERALAGEKVITRDGTLVSEIYHFKTSRSEFPLKAVINGLVNCHLIDGKCDAHSELGYDLFMADEEKEMCVICDKEERMVTNDSFYCERCFQDLDSISMCKLAERIKALEEKLK
jgi:hypothetical protein